MTAADTPSREDDLLALADTIAESTLRIGSNGVLSLEERLMIVSALRLAAKPADDGVREATIEEVAQRIFAQIDPIARKGRHEIQRMIRALSPKAKP